MNVMREIDMSYYKEIFESPDRIFLHNYQFFYECSAISENNEIFDKISIGYDKSQMEYTQGIHKCLGAEELLDRLTQQHCYLVSGIAENIDGLSSGSFYQGMVFLLKMARTLYTDAAQILMDRLEQDKGYWGYGTL